MNEVQKAKLDNVWVIDCTHTINTAYGKMVGDALEQLVSQGQLAGCKAVAINLNNTYEMTYGSLRLILPHVKKIRKANLRFFAMNVPKSVPKFLAQYGVDTAIQVVSNLDEIGGRIQEAKAKKKTPKLDLRFTAPFVDAVVNTLSTQAKLSPRPKKPQLKKHIFSDNTELASFLELRNEAYEFRISMGMSRDLAKEITTEITGNVRTYTDDEMGDCLCELLNIMYTQAKSSLKEYGFYTKNILPRSLTSEQVAKFREQPIPTIEYVFTIKEWTFSFEFAVKKVDTPAAQAA